MALAAELPDTAVSNAALRGDRYGITLFLTQHSHVRGIRRSTSRQAFESDARLRVRGPRAANIPQRAVCQYAVPPWVGPGPTGRLSWTPKIRIAYLLAAASDRTC